jgi:hypothetical protein
MASQSVTPGRIGVQEGEPDANDTLWFRSGGGGGNVLGWLNTKEFLRTVDAAKSQGWTPLILDTSGSGKRGEYVQPDQVVDPTKGKRIGASFYGIAVSPVDGSIWGSVLGYPGEIVRVNPGSNPSEHRRPAAALEGQRTVDHVWFQDALADGDRQGDEA